MLNSWLVARGTVCRAKQAVGITLAIVPFRIVPSFGANELKAVCRSYGIYLGTQYYNITSATQLVGNTKLSRGKSFGMEYLIVESKREVIH